MKLIIAGGREFNDYDLLKKSVDEFIIDNLSDTDTEIEIVSGRARGADKLGEKYAKEYGYSVVCFPADWSLGRRAGFLRNKDMAEYADSCICFWDQESKGTKHMIDLATRYNLKLKIVKY